jgi:hypothetical protein
MRPRPYAIAISFSMSFAMSYQRRASSSRLRAGRASTSSTLRNVFQGSFSNLPIQILMHGSVSPHGPGRQASRMYTRPLPLDVSEPVWPIASADGIICNIPTGSPLYPYGPYLREGSATAPSNQAVERSLAIAIRPGVCGTSRRFPIAHSVGFSTRYHRNACKQSGARCSAKCDPRPCGRPARDLSFSCSPDTCG